MLALYPNAVYASRVATIGGNIVKAREAAGIKTQSALADRLGVKQPQMSDWENDRYRPDTKTLMRIALAIPCTYQDLIRGVDGYDVVGSNTVPMMENGHDPTAVKRDIAQWHELAAMWDDMTTGNHHALLTVARSFARLPQAEAQAPAEAKRKTRSTARPPR